MPTAVTDDVAAAIAGAAFTVASAGGTTPLSNADRAMTRDLYDGHWDFWAQSEVPLDERRERYGVAPLDIALAALDDEHVRRADFERPGLAPPPPISSVPITDHPIVAPPPPARS